MEYNELFRRLPAKEPNDLQKVFVSIGQRIFWHEWLATYRVIEQDTGLSRKRAQQCVKELRDGGVVLHGYGVDDDGMLAGSGFYIDDQHKQVFEEASERLGEL